MRLMRKLVATLAATALLVGGVAAGPAAAAKGGHGIKSSDLSRKACEKRGGTFIDLDGVATICLFPK